MTCGPFDKPLLRLGRLAPAWTALAAAAALGGCAATNPFAAPVDKSSPAAPAIAEARKAPGPYPSWSHFPRGPQPTPPPSQIASTVADLHMARADLLSSAAKLDWTLSGTEGFAAQARAQINPAEAAPAPADQEAQTEAYAKALREQATPPPAPK